MGAGTLQIGLVSTNLYLIHQSVFGEARHVLENNCGKTVSSAKWNPQVPGLFPQGFSPFTYTLTVLEISVFLISTLCF